MDGKVDKAVCPIVTTKTGGKWMDYSYDTDSL